MKIKKRAQERQRIMTQTRGMMLQDAEKMRLSPLEFLGVLDDLQRHVIKWIVESTRDTEGE